MKTWFALIGCLLINSYSYANHIDLNKAIQHSLNLQAKNKSAPASPKPFTFLYGGRDITRPLLANEDLLTCCAMQRNEIPIMG